MFRRTKIFLTMASVVGNERPEKIVALLLAKSRLPRRKKNMYLHTLKFHILCCDEIRG